VTTPTEPKPVALVRWLGSVNADNEAGCATFQAGNETATVPMACFADARAVAKLIELARSQGHQAAHTALTNMLLGAMQTTKKTA